MSELPFNRKHPRFIRASVQKISHKVVNALFVLVLIGIATASVLVILNINSGYFIAAALVLPFMFCLWYKADIVSIQPNLNSSSPEDLLTSELLAHISGSSLNAKTAIEACFHTDSYLFFERRFGLSKDILSHIAEELQADWWGATQHLYQVMPNEEGIDAAHIIVAVVLSSQSKQAILTSIASTEKDILSGLSWLLYWKELQRSVKSRKSKGGIARDWATGYTPMLDRFAYNMSRDIQYGGSYHRDIFGHQQIVDQLQSTLLQAGRSNIILVGETGVGKTTCVEAFAERLLFNLPVNSPLRFHKIYKVDTAAMQTQLNSQNMLENALYSLALEAKKAKNILLYFPDISNLFGIEGGIDLSTTILPIVQNGTVRMIFSASEGQWKWLQLHKPQLASLMNFQAVNAPNQDDAMRILENQAIFIEHQYNCLFTYNGLKEVYSLASRYGPEVAMPEKAINVMETVARINAGAMINRESVALAIEQTTGVKAGNAGASEKNILMNLEAVLHQKVIGQKEAIKSVVSALTRSRTGISNQNKPIGTFLFLGPTGVGKTETAKAVASAYFGGEDRLIRVDMNEFVTKESLDRMLESGSTQSNSLLDSIRKQPFSVVLFDEIEKAHPDVVNSLLQMLDEGVIRDNTNKTISFKDAIIIATSNAGAEHIAEYDKNFQSNPQQAKQQFTQALIASGIFKPEFINRFDNVIIYQPLHIDELEQVVDINIRNLNDTIANQQLSVSLTPEARTWLAKNGYDPLMGARPLRRLIQQTVEDALSKKILEGSLQSGSGQNVVFDVADLVNEQ